MLKGFDFQKKLGEGAYSSVYRVKRQEDASIYALKMVKLKELNEVEKINALNEVRIIASVRSPNVVNYKECFIDKQLDALCIVMDYASEGDLLQKIQEHQKKGTYMKEEDIWNIFIQIVKGLKCMHDMNIMHRDMKSANVFLYDEKVAKLGDFNVSKLQKKSLLYTQTGTPYYASPEVWKDMPYDKKADIWSLGCVLYEMAALRPPFKAEDMQALYKKIISGKFSRIPDFYSNDLMYIINQLLQVQPYYRPSCNQILKNNIVRKYFLDRHHFEAEERSIMLNTIKFPKDFKNLELPKSNYSPIKLKKVSQHVKTLENDNNIESNEDLKSQRLLTENEDDHHNKKNLPSVNDKQQSKDNPLNEYRVENLYNKGSSRHRNSSIKKSAQQLSNDNSPLPLIQNQRKLSLSISKNNQCTIASSQKEAEIHRQILKSNTNGTSNISQVSYNVQDDRQNYLALKQFIIKQKGRQNRNLSPLQSSSQTPEKKEKLINNSMNYSNNNIIKLSHNHNNNNQSSNQRILPQNVNKDYEPSKPTFKINYRQQTLSPNLSMKKPPSERQNINVQNPPESISPYKLLPKIYSSSINQQQALNNSGIDSYVRQQHKIKKRVYSNQATLNYEGSQDLSYEEPSYYKLNQTKDVNDYHNDQDFQIRTPSQNKKKIKYQSVDNNNSFLNHQKIKDQIILKQRDPSNNISIISADDISTKSKRRNSNKQLEKRSARQNHFKDKELSSSIIHSNNNNNNSNSNTSNILVKMENQQQ